MSLELPKESHGRKIGKIFWLTKFDSTANLGFTYEYEKGSYWPHAFSIGQELKSVIRKSGYKWHMSKGESGARHTDYFFSKPPGTDVYEIDIRDDERTVYVNVLGNNVNLEEYRKFLSVLERAMRSKLDR